jgi:predicted nuclease of predicted toxin-antitoxin system
VLTPGEAGLLGASDDEYLAHSRGEGRVLVTHDGDFLRLHRLQEHAGIVYCEQGTRTIGQLVAGLVLIYEILQLYSRAMTSCRRGGFALTGTGRYRVPPTDSD